MTSACAEKTETARVVAGVAEVLSGLLRKARGGRADHCILACRIASDIFSYFEIAHDVYPTRVLAFNQEMLDYIREHDGVAPADLDTLGDGPWSVGSFVGGLPLEPGRFGGHVTLVLPDGGERVLVDLALGQFSRPSKGIDLPDSLVVGLSEPWKPGVRHAYAPPGVPLLLYEREPDTPLTRSWKRALDWRATSEWSRRITGSLIRDLRP